MNCWTPWLNQPQLHWHAVPVNLITIAMVCCACGMFFELWRRVRRYVWQLHLRDMFAVMLLVACAGAWYAASRNRHAREEYALGGDVQNADGQFITHGILSHEKMKGGLTWMRQLAGDQHFQFLDRVTEVEVESGGLAWLSDLPDVRLVHIRGGVTSNDLKHLESLRRLEIVYLGSPPIGPGLRLPPLWGFGGATEVLIMPRLPHLRGLVTGGVRCERLSNLSSLEYMQLRQTSLDERFLRELTALRELRALSLYQCSISPDGLAHLSSLPQLRSLELSLSDVDDTAMRHILQLKHLRELALPGTNVTREAISQFTQMKQLRLLRLTGPHFGATEQKVLEEALPQCVVQVL